jgi:hypothetical protein
MDTSIWSTWHDLDPTDEVEHIAWLHGTYLPALRNRPGILWVAHYRNVGGGKAMDALHERMPRSTDPDSQGGSTHIIMAGAVSALSFLRPSLMEQESTAVGETRRMLDQRRRPQQFIFTEYARVNGPEWGHRMPGSVPAPGIQFGALRSRSLEGEHYAGRWYAEYRLPTMASMPGCVAARTLLCNYGWPKFGVLYEFTSRDAREVNFEPHETLAGREKRSQWVGPLRDYVVHVSGSPVVAERLWPPVT